MAAMQQNTIHKGNSVISVETHPEYAHPVVIKKSSKKHPSLRINQSLQKEYEMTRFLDEIAGVRKAFGKMFIENQPVLILEYIDGETLRDYMVSNRPSLRVKLEITVDLTRILGKVHQLDVIHLDLNSKNILIANDHRAVRLIDLGSASHIDKSGHQKVRPDQALGTLPYISPEKTGRINRAVDERSDLYSLGVVLYELVTGRLPFDSRNPIELIHSHIARVPVSPSEVSSGIPEVISAIILKLLSKTAEDRYQCAAGVQTDLEKCLRRLSPDDTIAEFPLGEADYASRLRFPQKLYGRDRELKDLESAFESVCRDTSSIVFVSGYSGIGKTALVEEIQKPVSETKGYFIRGKFDQYLRTTPYSGITQAFDGFMAQILAEPEDSFNKWREKIQSAVGKLGKVLIQVIPVMEELMGTQPDVPQLGDEHSENRFNYVFINFLATVATEEHPLVLFIDDLQWIDAASLRLLKVIETNIVQPGLLVIGAYRENEVDNSHPLMEFINKREEKAMPLRLLKLNELKEQHLEALLSDTLKNSAGIKELEEIFFEKTLGNPFFVRRLLSSLMKDRRISYDSEVNSWIWDVRDIKSETVADNVADLLAKNIAILPAETRNILTLAACIGNRFKIHTLAVISELNEPEVLKLLAISLSGQYIFESGGNFEFVHDQVQQAVYSLLDENDKIEKHLEIGRLLLADTDESKLEEALFDIVHHFNKGAPLLESESEKVMVAELNLKAASKGRSAAAYTEGFAYVEQGLALLDTDSWQHHSDLTLAMYNEAAELSYLTGNTDRVDEFEANIHKNAKSILDRTRVYYIRTMIDTDQGRLLESIETGIDVLAELGITVSRKPSPEDIERAEAAFTEALAIRSMEGLAHLPEATDRNALAAMEIIAAVLLNAYIASPQHLSLLTYRGASLSLQHGNGPWSPFFYGVVVLLWAGAVDVSPTDKSAKALEKAQKLAQVLLRLLENPRYARCKAKTLDALIASLHLHIPLREMRDLSLEIYQAGLDTGDLVYAGLGVFHLANFGLALGMDLNQYIKTVSAYRQRVLDIGQDYTYRMTGIGLQTAENLVTPCAEPDILEDTYFNESQWLPDAMAANDGLTLFLVFQTKLLLSYHFDRDDRLMEYCGEAEKYLESVYGMVNIGFFRFYDSLSRLRLSSSLSAAERELALKRVESDQLRMRIWAQSGPMTFQHKFDLVAAETARVSGNIGPAIENYERAIEGARDNGFIHEQALANELYARFWQKRGNDKIAEMYMRKAHALFHQWGADAKVCHLENRYPQWFQAKTILTREPDTPDGTDKVHTTLTRIFTPIQMELESIMSASRTLSSETNLDQLLIKMLELVMATSGATNAVLLLRRRECWYMQARSDIETEMIEVLSNRPFDMDDSDKESDLVPKPVFQYCRRSKEVLLVADVRLDHRFAKIRMIQAHNIKSMACIPVLAKGRLKSMLYLENRHVTDAFSLERVEILKHLASQFGVSVENAVLYDDLNLKIQKLHESEERLSLIYDSVEEILFYINVEPDDCFRFSTVNPVFLKATELTRDQIVGKRIEEVIPETSVQLVLEYCKKAIKEKRIVRWEETSVYPSGEKTGIVSIAPVFDKKGICTHLAGFVYDITDRKQAEIKLHQAFEEIEALKNQLEAESAYLQDEIKLEHNFKNIIGQSEALKYVLHRVEQVAAMDTPVLIMGETGTGKELIARALHELSPRRKRALVKVNCAALPRELIEAELFGREKGAYTGATSSLVGRFELASGSTLFLDEIGELPLELQAKLLRVLESGAFERLGSTRTLRSDARIITATNRVLEEEVRKGRFREDLWYRLKVFPITVPPLHERPEDIPLLVKWFVDQLSRKMGKQVAMPPKRTMEMLQRYPWPGNVRELQHAIESALITARGKKLNFELPQIDDFMIGGFNPLEEMERDYILRVLKARNWKIGGKNSAAQILGMHVNTLRGRMKRLGIKKPKLR